MSLSDKFKNYGLKEEKQIFSLEDLLDAAEYVEASDSGATVTDVIDNKVGAANLISSLTDIEDMSEPSNDNPSLETVSVALRSILKSHGAEPKRFSLEDRRTISRESIVNETKLAIEHVKKDLQISNESYGSDIRKDINKRYSILSNGKQTLEVALKDIGKNRAQIEQNGVTINHKGFYNFLFIDGVQVKGLGNALKADISALQRLRKMIDEFSKEIHRLTLTTEPKDQRAYKDFVNSIIGLNVERRCRELNGRSLLNNGKIKVISYNDEDIAPWAAMEVNYSDPEGDGSKASFGERFSKGLKHAAAGGMIGGLVGAGVGFIIGGPLGAGVGAGVGSASIGGLGGVSGVRAADKPHQGSNTDSRITLDEALNFIKDGIIIADDLHTLEDILSKAEKDLAGLEKLSKDIIRNVKDDAILVGFINAFGSIAHDKRKRDNPNIGEYERIKTHKETVTELLNEHIQSVEWGYLSMVDVLVHHSFICVKNTMEIANRLSK